MHKDEKNKRRGGARKHIVIYGRDVSVNLVAAGIASVIATFIGPWLLLSLVPWAGAHWKVVVFGALVVFAAISVVLLTMHLIGGTQIGLLRYKAIVGSCGIEGFHPLTTPSEKKVGWGDCVGRISEVPQGELCLAVITGASTFASEPREGEENHRSPLRKTLDEHKGDLRILLMEKGCAAWEQCIKEFGKGDRTEEKKFRIELEDGHVMAQEFCEYLAGKPSAQLRSIEVRLYDRSPLWKMVIMANYIWVQHYIPGERIDDLPAYVVRRGVLGGMAYPLQNVFEYRWKLSEGRVLIHRNRDNVRVV